MAFDDSEIAQFFEEYDALTEDVSSAGFQQYPNTLKRWTYFLNDNEISGPIIKRLTGRINFETWFNSQGSGGSFVGSRSFDWPVDNEDRLGLQLTLFGGFVSGAIPLNDILVNYFYRTNNLTDMLSNLDTQLFSPMARDLRRYITRVGKNPVAEVPASDRVVSIDHNSASYQDADAALSTLETALEQSNEYPDPDDKSQKVAEISAVRRLLQATRVRVEAVIALISRGLKYLKDVFVGAVIGLAAERALEALETLLGSPLP